jgi:RimJ/RimL family protein N-acetyltransferase
VLASDAFLDLPVLIGTSVRLEPLTEAVFDDYWAALADPEVNRLTGTHATFEAEQVRAVLRHRREQHDRADWAILRQHDGAFLGEAVINDFDPHNESANYRIWLGGPAHFGRGYGTEVTRLVVDYAFDRIGLHRLELEVFAFNPRARRVYEKCGFQLEGTLRDALLWDGIFIDTYTMAILRTDPERAGTGGHHSGVAASVSSATINGTFCTRYLARSGSSPPYTTSPLTSDKTPYGN